MPQLIKVELRCGLLGWVERLQRKEGDGLWDWIGYVVRRGGVTEGPHLWRYSGKWLEGDNEHDLDIVRGLRIKPAAAQEKGAAP